MPVVYKKGGIIHNVLQIHALGLVCFTKNLRTKRIRIYVKNRSLIILKQVGIKYTLPGCVCVVVALL